MSPTDWIVLGSALINFIVMLTAANISSKISQLKADIYATFLTKDDYFEYQKRRDFRGNNRRM